MILPTKHLPADRALLTIGARILAALEEPKTISSLWDKMRVRRDIRNRAPMSYDWFILSLDLLFLLGAVHFASGLIRKGRSDDT